MRKNRKAISILLIVFLSLISLLTFAQTSRDSANYAAKPDTSIKYPIIIVWQLDISASEFKPGPGWKQQTRIYFYTADRKKVKMIATGTREDGTPILFQYAAAYDGKDYPISGNPKAETIALTRIDEYTITGTTKRGGIASQTTKSIVSQDGMTLTVNASGTDEKGVKFNNRLILHKLSQ